MLVISVPTYHFPTLHSLTYGFPLISRHKFAQLRAEVRGGGGRRVVSEARRHLSEGEYIPTLRTYISTLQSGY
jgi:hypothetical protein